MDDLNIQKVYKIEDIARLIQKGVDNFSLYKPYGMSSFGIVRYIKHRYTNLGIYKIGHGGTLDPLAEGVLPILINNGTKKQQSFQNMKKIYSFKMILPLFSDSYDLEKNINIVTSDFVINHLHSSNLYHNIENVLNKFIGENEYYVYKYAALKSKGRRLYESINNIFKPKVFTVYKYDFSLNDISKTTVMNMIRQRNRQLQDTMDFVHKSSFMSRQLRMLQYFYESLQNAADIVNRHKQKYYKYLNVNITVGGGTYIRVLAYYLAARIGVPGVIVELKREGYIETDGLKLGD